MVDHISQLPDDILCYILSLLPLRDAVRTRSSIYSCRFLPDTRSTLEFDTFNVFGKETSRYFNNEIRSKFVAAVDQFMKQPWRGTRISALHVNFDLGNEHALHLDRWIATAIRMGVEEIHLDFIHSGEHHESYQFSSGCLDLLKSSSLKRLCLRNCAFSSSPGCKNWLSHLTILELSCVIISETAVGCILSGALKLTSLAFSDCCLPTVFRIDGQLHCLKKLVIKDYLMTILLNCQNLESFKYCGGSDEMTFAHVPKLKKVNLWLRNGSQVSRILENLMGNAPQLEALSLSKRIDILPLLSAEITWSCLRKLDLDFVIPMGFDYSTVVHFLKVSPLLEILHLKLTVRERIHNQQVYYGNSPHFKLKEVKIEGFELNALELIVLLLKKAVALQHLIIKTSNPYAVQRLTNLVQKQISTSAAKVTIQ